MKSVRLVHPIGWCLDVASTAKRRSSEFDDDTRRPPVAHTRSFGYDVTMKSWYWAGLGVAVIAIASCSDDTLRCGPGTVRKGGECVRQSSSSAGSSNSGTDGAGTGNTVDMGSAGDRADDGAGGDKGSSAGAAGEGGSGGEGGGEGGSAGGGNETDLITTALDCGSRNITNAIVMPDTISKDMAWAGVIYLPNGLKVQNEPTLIITPGTKIIVGRDASIDFGVLGSHATIIAKGTVDEPITFCGETDAAGHWAGMIFRSGIKSESVLKNVLIADGGGTDAALTLEMPLAVQGVQVRNSHTNGVNAVGFHPSSSTLIVSGAAKAAVKATAAKGVEVPINSQLTGNGLDLIDLAFSSFDADVTFRDLGVPYRQVTDSTASVAAVPPVVTLEPGVTYSLAKQKQLDFGNATVHALGNASKPIVFQGLNCPQLDAPCFPGASGTAESGSRVVASGADVRFQYVDFRQLGTSTDAALTVSATSLAVDHVNITGAPSYGLTFLGSGKFSAGSNNLSVNSAQSSAVFKLGCGAMASLPPDTKMSSTLDMSPMLSTAHTVVNCAVVTSSSTWSAAGSPYWLSGLEIDGGASLTVSAGTTLRIAPSGSISVLAGGALTALGTLAAPIQFAARDASNWGGLSTEVGATAQLDYVVVDRAGANGSAISAGAPIGLTHSTISNSSSWGLKKSASDQTDYGANNAFLGNASGDVGTLP